MGSDQRNKALTVPVVIDTDRAHEGEVEWRLDYTGRAWPERIILRTASERVLLHETLHALIGTLDVNPLPPSHPDHEAMVRHVTRGLWDAGWRRLGDTPASDDKEVSDGRSS
jgi:hypothetical protein